MSRNTEYSDPASSRDEPHGRQRSRPLTEGSRRSQPDTRQPRHGSDSGSNQGNKRRYSDVDQFADRSSVGRGRVVASRGAAGNRAAPTSGQQQQDGAAAGGAPPIEWSLYQSELDRCFHGPRDAYPVGSAEHDELLQFVPKLHKVRSQRKAAAAPAGAPTTDASGDSQSPARAAAAEALGILVEFDPRFRVNVSIASDPNRLRDSARALDRIAAHTAAPGSATGGVAWA